MVESVKTDVFKETCIILGMTGFLLVAGTTGFMFLEGWNLLDAFYMTITTVTTVGFGEVHPLDGPGKGFTIILILSGVGLIAYTLGSLVRLLVEGQFRYFFIHRRARKMIGSLKGHFIVCGFGRIGALVCRQLTDEGVPIVVVEKRAILIEELDKKDYLYVDGDATQEETLLKAGIHNAHCLISALGTDAGNVYTALTARHLNPKIIVVCRCEEEEAEDKMLKAGANKVISPYRIGGASLANAGLRPNVLDFIELVTAKKQLELSIEEVPVPPDSPMAGRSLVESKIRERFGIMVVACLSTEGDAVFNPPAHYTLRGGDVLVALGKPESFKRLHDELL